MANVSKPNPKNLDSDFFLKYFRVLGRVMNQVGIAGFIVLAVTVIIFTFSSQAQKSEIIDYWVLFKGDRTPFYIIILVLMILLIGQNRYYKEMLRIKQNRIDELAKLKSDFYRNKIEPKISTITKNKKP